MEPLPEEQKIVTETATEEKKSRKSKKWRRKNREEGKGENEEETVENIREKKFNPNKFFSDSFISFLSSSALLPEVRSIKEAKKVFTGDMMVKAISNVFERHLPSNSRYTPEDIELFTKLLKLFTQSYESEESFKEVFSSISKIESLIPPALVNPKTKRNVISLVYGVLEDLVRSNPTIFFDEFCKFFVLMAKDLKAQAEESLAENDPLFIENFQRCYVNIPYMALLYSDNPEMYEKVIKLLTTEFNNSELSIYQSYVLFTCFSMLARKRGIESKDNKFYNVEVTTKKYVLSILIDGSFKSEGTSLIFVLRRAIDTNIISFEIKGRCNLKFKVDKQVNISYVRSLLDINYGINKDQIHKLKVLDKSKTGEAILYSQVAFYSILWDALTGDKLDQKKYICDTLLNLAIVNNPSVSKYAVETLASCSLFADTFFQNTLFTRLASKMVEFDDSIRLAEREKSSDFVLHPHAVMNLRHLINQSLNGQQLTPYSKSLVHHQSSSLGSNTLIYLLLCINAPAVYNFNENGGIKWKIIKNYLLKIKEHYKSHSMDFTDAIAQIKDALISKLSTRLFIMSDKAHMRTISVNICGTTSWFSQEFCEAICNTFKLKTVLEQVTKCLASRRKFKEEYAHIAFYDMNHIADSADGLMKVFHNKMKSIQANSPAEEPEEESKIVKEVKEAPKTAADMNKFLMGGGGGKKKPTKGKKPVKEKEVKPVKEKKAVVEQKVDSSVHLVEESKDARIIRDLRTVNSFLDNAFEKSCIYLNSICSIYELASKEKSDKIMNEILYQNIHIFIELLRYPASNFIVKAKINQLLSNYSGENSILRIKDWLIECLLLSARLLNKANLSKDNVDKQYRIFFKIINEDSFDFNKLGKGIIRLILTNIKFAIKHSEISHTLKENAVSIAIKILGESSQYNSLDVPACTSPHPLVT